MRTPFKCAGGGSEKVDGEGKSLCLAIWIAQGIEN